MRRKPSTLLPIELSILNAGMSLRQRGTHEFHGYGVAKEIRDGREARRLTAHGTLYRALDRLEQRELLLSRLEDPDAASAENRPRRRLYTVTALGVKVAQAASQPASMAPMSAAEKWGTAP